jgi:hypothetical protein
MENYHTFFVGYTFLLRYNFLQEVNKNEVSFRVRGVGQESIDTV